MPDRRHAQSWTSHGVGTLCLGALNMCKKCPDCESNGVVKIGNRCYCRMHARIRQMRTTANARAKFVPSRSELETMFASLHNMECPLCTKTMLWSVGLTESRSAVVTLQHDNDGNIRLLCFGCNARHSAYGDAIYSKDLSKHVCTQCKQELPKSEFLVYTEGTSGVRSWCKKCNCEIQKQYRKRRAKKLKSQNGEEQ